MAGGSGAETRGHSRMRGVLVAAEAALVVVAIGAGLLLRSLDNLLSVDSGFDAERAVSMQVTVPEYKYSTNEEMQQFFLEVLESVRQVPGVAAAGLVRPMPLAPDTFQGEDFRFTVVGQPLPVEGQEPAAVLRFASAGICAAMGCRGLPGATSPQPMIAHSTGWWALSTRAWPSDSGPTPTRSDSGSQTTS